MMPILLIALLLALSTGLSIITATFARHHNGPGRGRLVRVFACATGWSWLVTVDAVLRLQTFTYDLRTFLTMVACLVSAIAVVDFAVYLILPRRRQYKE